MGKEDLFLNKGAIWDVDGTILDSMPVWRDAAARWLGKIGVQAEENLDKILYPMSLEEGASYLIRAYDLNQTKKEVIDGVLDVVRDAYEREVPAKPGAAVFLARMKEQGIPMILATSGSRELARAALERLGLWELFDGMITCDEEGAGKGDPRVFLLAAERMGLPPRDIFVFEDSIQAVRTANAAGFVTVGVYEAEGEAGNEAADDEVSGAADGAAGNEAMRRECSIYLHTLENYEVFCAKARDII